MLSAESKPNIIDEIRLALRGVEPLREEYYPELESRGDHDLNPGTNPVWAQFSPKEAAVLVAITRGTDPHMILTTRKNNLRDHAGQIAFPGGKREAGESALQTASREASEEIELDPAVINLIGYLDPYYTVTGYRVIPVVVAIESHNMDELSPNPDEVEDIFEVPLSFLLNRENHEQHSGEHKGIKRSYYAMPYDQRYIWGATAGMIRNMSDRLLIKSGSCF